MIQLGGAHCSEPRTAWSVCLGAQLLDLGTDGSTLLWAPTTKTQVSNHVARHIQQVKGPQRATSRSFCLGSELEDARTLEQNSRLQLTCCENILGIFGPKVHLGSRAKVSAPASPIWF